VDLLGELRGARSASTKEAVAAVERTAYCAWMTATDPERWVGLLERFGLLAAPSSCQKRPVKVMRDSVQQTFISRSPSVKRAMRLVGSASNAENILPLPPVAKPTSMRPRLS